MDLLLYILFFAVIFGANLIKGVMEERERARTHEAARRFKNPPPAPRAAQRKIGGYSVFEEESRKATESVLEEAAFEEATLPAEKNIEVRAQDLRRNYEAELAEAEKLIADYEARAAQILGGDFAENSGAQCAAPEILKGGANLAEAVILSEIIQPPLSMRRG